MPTEFRPAAWVSSTNIYEVNLRQYTAEGTFLAFSKHLTRLKDMGVEVLHVRAMLIPTLSLEQLMSLRHW